MTEKLEIPTEFICPITQELLNDPVIGSDGHTYERGAIEQWLSTHYSSPMTRQPMQASELVPNLALRNIIETMYGKNVPKIKDNSSVVVIPSTPVAASDKVDLRVDATQTGNYEYLVHVSAVPPDQGTRKPCVFIAVLDVSGSMEDEATIGNEGHGFSRLDLVKHSMNTIIHVMEPQDYLAIVAFSSNASVELPLIPMTATGKTQALAKVKNLRPDGSTNIWDGLRVGLELTKNPICQNHNIAMVLLTDGEPNINPPRGIVPTLEKYISANPLNCVIHTFGFGYHLDSPLLNEIAQVGSGLYAFIPDASMVGTIFVNFLANTLATSAKRASIVVEKGTSDDISFIGYPSSTDKVDLGTIQYGQTRDLVIKVRNLTTKPNLKVTLKYDSDQEVSVQLSDIHTNNLTEVYVQYSRLFMVERLLKIMQKVSSDNNCRDSVRLLNEVVTTLKNMPSCSDKRILAMIRDLESEEENEAQVRKALSKDDWYRKWGKHYIPSLVRAHILQQCNNFKDKGVQVYGGKLFTELQDAADTIFCNLPPPTPSVRGSYHNNSVTNMSTYYNVSSGCFSGDGRVAMADGTTKLVMHLCKDDKVQTVDGRSARIRCVIKSSTLNPTSSPLVELNGVKVTPYHPVRLNSADKWVFPCDVKQPEYIPCNHVYNLVLESDHIVNINGIEFITLGHGIVDDPVLAHPFYGTDRVIEELQQMEGWNTGLIAINDYEVIRDQETGLVSAIIPKQIPVQ